MLKKRGKAQPSHYPFRKRHLLAAVCATSLFSSTVLAATGDASINNTGIKNTDIKNIGTEKSNRANDKATLEHYFFLDGQALKPWISAIGDPAEWYIPITESHQVSNKGAISLTSNSKPHHETVIDWRSEDTAGTFTVTGKVIDLEALSSQRSLVVELKMHHKIRQALRLSMDCTYPCRGSLNIRPLLNRYPIKQWIKLPIPLECFQKLGTDLSKVSAPLHLESKGNITISLRSVSLQETDINKGLCENTKP